MGRKARTWILLAAAAAALCGPWNMGKAAAQVSEADAAAEEEAQNRTHASGGGFEKIGDCWYLCEEDGTVLTETGFYCGAVDGAEGDWYVENGKVSAATGVFLYGDAYYLMDGGRIASEFTGLYECSPTRYYCFDAGVGNCSFNGFVAASTDRCGSGEYYVNGGIVDIETCFQKSGDAYWYLTDGKKSSLTGFRYGMASSNGWWYVEDGKVKDTTGFVNGTVDGSRADWYVNNGKVDFAFNGIASNKNGPWVIKNGKVDFSYSGRYRYKGRTYRTKNGKAR